MSYSPYVPYFPRAWRNNHKLGVASTILHIAAGATAVFPVAAILRLHNRVNAYRHGSITAQQLTDATNHYFQLSAIPSLFLVANLVVWIILLFRMVRNRETIGRPNTRFNAGWAVAGPLIPLLSSVLPWLQMNELWKGAHPDDPPMSPEWRQRPGSSIIMTWWAVMLGAQVASLAGSAAVTGAMFSAIGDIGRGGDLVSVAEKLVDNNLKWFVAASLLTGLANVVGAFGIRVLVERQESYARRWHLAAAPAPAYYSSYSAAPPAPYGGVALAPPAGWYPDPSGRHHHRWWDGTGWTPTVADNGVSTTDAL